MPKTFQNEPVTEVRDAKKGDPNFDAATDQVVIRLANGTEKTVLRSDVTNAD